jgi:hypothetical protein
MSDKTNEILKVLREQMNIAGYDDSLRLSLPDVRAIITEIESLQAAADTALVAVVRELIEELRATRTERSVCPHGTIGLCMYCMRDVFAGRSA